MATVWAFIRTTTKAKAKVRFRVTGDNGEIVFHTSEITVLPDQWDKKGQCIKAKVLFDADERADFNKAVADRKELLRKIAEQRHEQHLQELRDRAVEAYLEVASKHTLLKKEYIRTLPEFKEFTQKLTEQQ